MLDYRELKKFYAGYAKAAQNLEAFLIDFLLKEARWVQGATKDRTPVDTGNLRRHWYITNVYRLIDGNLCFELYNDADYADFVELGHTTRKRDKWVEGYYMATISIARLEERLPMDFNREFNRFLRRFGVL